MHINDRERVLSALEKDISRRYISIGKLQSDGRLELDKACIDILQPQKDEVFSIISDNSSIIIVRRPSVSEKVIYTTRWDANKKRLRLPPSALRILLACTVGVRVFTYNDEIALELEPYLQTPNSLFFDSETVEQLAPFVLRSPRSVLHVDILSPSTVADELFFKLVGEFWDRRQHQNPLDKDLNWILCTGSGCDSCEKKFPIVSRTIWFPCLSYDADRFPRPSLLSFRMPGGKSVCEPLIKECLKFASNNSDTERYCDRGVVSYTGSRVFCLRRNDGDLFIDSMFIEDTSFSVEEKGLLKIAFKELQEYISQY